MRFLLLDRNLKNKAMHTNKETIDKKMLTNQESLNRTLDELGNLSIAIESQLFLKTYGFLASILSCNRNLILSLSTYFTQTEDLN